MKIYIGADHAGFELKEKLVVWLTEHDYRVTDFSAKELTPGDDYPDFIEPVAKEIQADNKSRGIILGGSGQGEAMDANRFPHVRAVEFYGGNLDVVKIAREHNDANVLSLGARFLSEDEAKRAVEVFLNTPFSGDERHVRRIDKIDDGV